MARLHEEQREALYRELSASPDTLDELAASLERDQDRGRFRFLDLMNLQGVMGRERRLSPGFAFEESLKGTNRWMYNELRRNFERTDRRAALRLRRDAAVERCAALCRPDEAHAADAGHALLAALREFPGDERLLALAAEHASRLGPEIPSLLRSFRSIGEFRDPVHALTSATCAVPDGFWTGNRLGVVRRFDAGGQLVEEHELQTGHVEKIFTDAGGRVWACDPLAGSVAVLAPGEGVLARVDMTGRLAPTRSGLSGCAGAHGVVLAAYDEAGGETTLYRVDDGFSLSELLRAPGHLQIAQAGDCLYAVEGFSQQVSRILPDREPLFALDRSDMARPTRMTRLGGYLLFYGKDVLAAYSPDGREALRTSFLYHSEGCSLLADVESDAAARTLCLANPNEPVVRIVEAVA